MADLVTSQIIENGPRFIVAKFTNLSDATGEAGVTKINATSSGPFGVVRQGQTIYPGTGLALLSIWYSISAMVLRIQWHGTPNIDMINLVQADNWQLMDQRGGIPGLPCPGGTGVTGSIDFTTVGAAANSAYTVVMKLAKNI